MSYNFKKVLSLVLACCMLATAVLTMASCAKDPVESTSTTTGTTPVDPVVYVDPYAKFENHYDRSDAIYNDILGEFSAAYEKAKNADSVAVRQALMAIAEAKLMESAVMVPTSTQGGNYAISRLAPYTVDYALWGNDYYRYHQGLVATEFITREHRDAMKAKWGELKGTGTYEDWARQFLLDNGYTLKDTYAQGYSSDPKTWDCLATSRSADTEPILNTYDGLVEYDCEGILQPAIAESWEISDDGLTYTFHLRKDAKWVDSQGREVGQVKADDFVAGMQHMMDAAGGLEYLVGDDGARIVNASAYVKGDINDFTKVGVKAVDDYTLVYTLEAPTSFFMTMLGYCVFAPMSREFYESKGGKFGADYDPNAVDYTYGKNPDNIAYCGPYLVKSATVENSIVFDANPTYWNKDNINLKTITWLYNDGSEQTKAYTDAKAGTIDGCGMSAPIVKIARDEGLFDKYAYTSATNATTFSAFYNVNRQVYANVADSTKCVSPQTPEMGERSNAALRNVHFRRAVSFAFDRASYNAQSVGEELKLNSVRNSYTPGNFIFIQEDVTVDINGKATTYKAGTMYGKIMQDQIDADGVKIKVWDPAGDSGAGSGDGFDGWYNVENAKAELEVAIKELAAIGIEVTAENPIYLDIPFPAPINAYANKSNAMKQSIEGALDGKVIVNLVSAASGQDWYDAGYYTENGQQANYNIYDVSGWGPDYGDPQSYLDTFLPGGAGYMCKCIGLF